MIDDDDDDDDDSPLAKRAKGDRDSVFVFLLFCWEHFSFFPLLFEWMVGTVTEPAVFFTC